MRFSGNLYNVLNEAKDGGRHSYVIRLNADHFIYKAHFPGEPITPGVCLLQISLELLEEYAGQSLSVSRIKNIKFLRVIRPDETPELTFDFQVTPAEDRTLESQVTVIRGGEIYAKLSLICQTQDQTTWNGQN